MTTQYPGYPYIPGITQKAIPSSHPSYKPQIWFAKQFKTGDDVQRINYNDTVRHGDFVVRVVSWAKCPDTKDILIVGVQTSYTSIVTSKYQEKVIWGPRGISHSIADYGRGTYLPRA